jgi:hypothetical protein
VFLPRDPQGVDGRATQGLVRETGKQELLAENCEGVMTILEQLSTTEGKTVDDISKALDNMKPEYVWRDLLSLAYKNQCWCDGWGKWWKLPKPEGAQK